MVCMVLFDMYGIVCMVGMVLSQQKSQRSLRSELAANSFSSNQCNSVCKIFNKYSWTGGKYSAIICYTGSQYGIRRLLRKITKCILNVTCMHTMSLTEPPVSGVRSGTSQP